MIMQLICIMLIQVTALLLGFWWHLSLVETSRDRKKPVQCGFKACPDPPETGLSQPKTARRPPETVRRIGTQGYP
jgi:hypothetical protein